MRERLYLVSSARRRAMHRRTILGVCGFILAAAAFAGEIHGTLSDAGKPVPKGTTLKLDCGGVYAASATDQFGSYSLKVAATGPCKVMVDYKGTSLALPVTLYEKPSRYDLVIQTEGDKSSLSRK
jgi:hypothetical protein